MRITPRHPPPISVSPGSTVFAAVNNLATPLTVKGLGKAPRHLRLPSAQPPARWSRSARTPGRSIGTTSSRSSPYGAAAVTNDVVLTTTYSGYLYAFNAATGAILLETPLSSGCNAPVDIDGDCVIVGAGVQQLIIAYQLGAEGSLPETVAP